MAGRAFHVRRRWEAIKRQVREAKLIARGALDTDHPVMVHIIPIRRCNLACAYCNEYDDYSAPVRTGVMLNRIGHLARLGTSVVTLSGGEPLMHPELEQIITRIREHGMLACMITNGLLLTVDRIQKLNDAGLDHLQISIDNLVPDDVSKKSLRTLDKKLQLLADHAYFAVNINSVIGGGVRTPEDALVIRKRASELGFSSTVGIIHDGAGQLRPLAPRELAVYEQMKKIKTRGFARLNFFQENIAHGRPHNWRCRAGSRYLYICEDGLVHYCSQQRGYPATPLEKYTAEDVRREYLTKKSCAPYCTISCVNQIAYFDFWRDPQTIDVPERLAPEGELVRIQSAMQ
jgi:MoaA/NifB/PqqE/SkfB family radical SAM enzyme